MPERTLSADALESRLAKHRGELDRAYEELKTADAREKAELRQEIEKLKDEIAADKKAKEDKEKAEGTGGTLVLPPEQTPQGQQHGDKPGDKPAGNVPNNERSGKKSILSRVW